MYMDYNMFEKNTYVTVKHELQTLELKTYKVIESNINITTINYNGNSINVNTNQLLSIQNTMDLMSKEYFIQSARIQKIEKYISNLRKFKEENIKILEEKKNDN